MSWSRLLPSGYENKISQDGVGYYHAILDELEKYKIVPIVTLYHWDHPQLFQELGGWSNELMVELFAEYARFVFREFGDRVKIFVTINEPQSFCPDGLYLGNKYQALREKKKKEKKNSLLNTV